MSAERYSTIYRPGISCRPSLSTLELPLVVHRCCQQFIQDMSGYPWCLLVTLPDVLIKSLGTRQYIVQLSSKFQNHMEYKYSAIMTLMALFFGPDQDSPCIGYQDCSA
jgi:hypothetical protein